MAIFTVNNLKDSGAGSLRQAIEDANALSGKDEIIFEDSLSGGEIGLTSGQITISDSLTITGLGADRLTVKGKNEGRSFYNQIFIISNNAEDLIDAEITGLTITGGNSSGARGAGAGGGILSYENLTVRESVISNNYAQDTGGGIYHTRGILKVQDSAIINNTVRGGFLDEDGAGIFNTGTAIIENTTIAGNVSSRGLGGGIANFRTLEIVNSTVTGNTSGNFPRSGAGIYNFYRNNNGEISQADITLTSSIVAGNSNNLDLGGGDRSDSVPIFNSGGNNLIGNADEVNGFTNDTNGDIVGTATNPIDPKLSVLQNNGGSTPTVALLSSSPAIDAGSNPFNLEFDQRGTGFNRVVDSSADIGAFEIQNSSVLVSIVATNPTAIEGGEDGVFTITRSGDLTSELTVRLAVDVNNTASNNDYSLNGNNIAIAESQITVTIPEGQSSTELTVNATDDTLAEEAETITLNLAAGEGYFIYSDNSFATTEIPRNNFDTGTVVTNTNDDGAGSLRQAVLIANSFPGRNTITFDSSLAGETITLTSGEIAITDSLDIEGLDEEQIIVSGNNSSRIFNIDDDAGNIYQTDATIDVTISKLTLTNGKAEGDSFIADSGGAIANSENLELIDSTVTGSTAEFEGGGINSYGNGSTVILNRSSIVDNSAQDGGGIANSSNSSLIINSSEIANNQAIKGSGIDNKGALELNNSVVSENSSGGGIYNRGNLELNNSIISGNNSSSVGGGIVDRRNARINNSIINNNSATRDGGGIYSSNDGNLEIINSTISGNTASENGGGIFNGGTFSFFNEGGNIAIANSTITDNSAGFYGSGVANFGDTIDVTSTIIAGNNNDEDIAGDAPFTSNGNNLIGNGDGAAGFTNGVNGDIVGTNANPIDPLLGTLQDNGGSTPTIALLDGSPAIDAGSNPLDLETDRRGEGFARVRGSQTDIGAFEADADIEPPDEGQLIIGTNKRDSLVGGAGNDTIDGSLARDTIVGGAGDDNLFGGRGKDLIFGEAGNDEIIGNQGGDTLEGGSGNDTLFGDEGRDVLVGGSGSDILIGGGAADNFALASGQGTDKIIDFEPRRDKLLLSEGLSFSGLTLNQNNEDVDIVLTDTNELLAVLMDIDVNNIREADFIAG